MFINTLCAAVTDLGFESTKIRCKRVGPCLIISISILTFLVADAYVYVLFNVARQVSSAFEGH